MDKQKQIEKILEKVGTRYGMDVGGISYIVNAYKLSPYLQPKIPEGAVVLSIEEYEKLKEENNVYKQLPYYGSDNFTPQECGALMWKAKQQGGKEMVKEIIEEIDNVKEIFPNDIVGYEQAQGWCMCIDKLKEIAKNKGVEVE